MGKQAKKKSESEKGSGQKKHNRSTRGINTKRKPVLFERKYIVEKDEKGKPHKVRDDSVIPPNTLWDPFDKQRNSRHLAQYHEPYDHLHLDWREEVMAHAAENGAKIEREILDDGTFRYVVYKEVQEKVGRVDVWTKKVLYEILSHRKLMLKGA